MSGTLRVAAGHITVMRLLEVAVQIDLARAEALWTAHAAGRAERARLAVTAPKAMAFGVPPLQVELEPVTLELAGVAHEVGITARLFDFGVVSLAVHIPANGLDWLSFVALANAADAVIGWHSRGETETEGESVWSLVMHRLRDIIGPALIRPVGSPLEEDYLLAVIDALEDRPSAVELLARVDLVPLLSGERRSLSEGARADLLRQRFSYYNDDLVVLTWDRAFIYEPHGDSDVADVLEIANAQLLEMRYYDELLDAELPRMYDLVEGARRRFNLFASRRYAALARRLYTLVAEVTELTEKVDNALQVTEDVYLARLYTAALDLLRVGTVRAAVERKLAIIRDTYSALYDEASSARSELMEVAIIALIMAEIVIEVFGLRR